MQIKNCTCKLKKKKKKQPKLFPNPNYFQKFKQSANSSVVPWFLVRKVENKSFPWMHKLGERTGQVWRDNSCCVRTHEKNSGETVHRLGTIMQSIFLCPIRSQHPLEFLEIVWWELVPGALLSVLKNFRPAFSPDPTDCPWVSGDDESTKSFNYF